MSRVWCEEGPIRGFGHVSVLEGSGTESLVGGSRTSGEPLGVPSTSLMVVLPHPESGWWDLGPVRQEVPSPHNTYQSLFVPVFVGHSCPQPPLSPCDRVLPTPRSVTLVFTGH